MRGVYEGSRRIAPCSVRLGPVRRRGPITLELGRVVLAGRIPALGRQLGDLGRESCRVTFEHEQADLGEHRLDIRDRQRRALRRVWATTAVCAIMPTRLSRV